MDNGIKPEIEIPLKIEVVENKSDEKLVKHVELKESLKETVITNVNMIIKSNMTEVSRDEVYDKRHVIIKNKETNELLYLYGNGGIRYINDEKEVSYLCNNDNFEALFNETLTSLESIYNVGIEFIISSNS